MKATEFALNPGDYGLPTRAQLQELRIWDLHYHGLLDPDGRRPSDAEHKELLFYIERFGIERCIALDMGGQRKTPLKSHAGEAVQQRILHEEQDRISGIVVIDPSEPQRSVEQMEKWIQNGLCVGIKYRGWGNRDSLRCDHPNNDVIIEAARKMNALIYVHTWIKVGGEPRRPGGGVNDGENTPWNLVNLAKRFPDVPFVCGHGGGDWEIGAQVVQPHKNILFEFAGSDPHSGSVDYAVRELGVDRIVWGGHGSSRSYSTELSKVLDADLTTAQRMQVLGGNVRRTWSTIFKRRGYRL
jgi:predicted TIM-barrel fold metal-dependent hydrolase